MIDELGSIRRFASESCADSSPGRTDDDAKRVEYIGESERRGAEGFLAQLKYLATDLGRWRWSCWRRHRRRKGEEIGACCPS